MRLAIDIAEPLEAHLVGTGHRRRAGHPRRHRHQHRRVSLQARTGRGAGRRRAQARRRLAGAVRAPVPRSQACRRDRWRSWAARRTPSWTRWTTHDLTVIGRDANFQIRDRARRHPDARRDPAPGDAAPCCWCPRTRRAELGEDGAGRLRRQRRRQAGHGQLRGQRPGEARARSMWSPSTTTASSRLGDGRPRPSSAEGRRPAAPRRTTSSRCCPTSTLISRLAHEIEAGADGDGRLHPLAAAPPVLRLGDARPGRERPNIPLYLQH